MAKMKTKVKLELNEKEIELQILKNPELAYICEQEAQVIAKSCVGNYKVDTRIGKKRTAVRVTANDYVAISDNYKNNTLLKVVKGMSK